MKVRKIRNKFHFKEIDWVIYFPNNGNDGRELINYGVAYRDRINKITQPGPKINFKDVLVKDSIKNGYPHTIGLFHEASGKGSTWKPQYVKTHIIQNEKELLEWISIIEIQV